MSADSAPEVVSTTPEPQVPETPVTPPPAEGAPAETEERAADYESTFRSLSVGDIVNGLVVHIDDHGALVDVGTKSEGVIPAAELREHAASEEGPIAVGDRIDVMVVTPLSADGNLVLSKKKADYERVWQRITDAHERGKVVTAMVTDRVKGGLVVDLGLRGFLPASHVAARNIAAVERLVGQSVRLKVLEVDRARKRVVVSQRLAAEEERSRKRDTTLETLEEGQIRKGVVRRVTDYGAFVDLGGVDGLLHVTEMSWTRVNHPSDVVKPGQRLEVMVLKYDRDSHKVSLGLKQILPDPWQSVSQRYRSGMVIGGKISRLVPFGAFVQLEEGIEGIIPNAELATRRVNRPEEVVKEGETVQVKVLSVKPSERRLSLSMRQVQQDRERREYREFTARQAEGGRLTVGDVIGEALAAAAARQAEQAEALAESPVAVEAEDPQMEPEAPELVAEAAAPAAEPEGSESAEPLAQEAECSSSESPEESPAERAPSPECSATEEPA